MRGRKRTTKGTSTHFVARMVLNVDPEAGLVLESHLTVFNVKGRAQLKINYDGFELKTCPGTNVKALLVAVHFVVQHFDVLINVGHVLVYVNEGGLNDETT